MSAATNPILWKPSAEDIAASRMSRYLEWLAAERGLKFADYPALWMWSTTELGAFWTSIADFFEVKFHEQATQPLSSMELPGAKWFPGATLNYAEHALRSTGDDAETVLIGEVEGSSQTVEISRAELRRRVACVAAELRRMGVQSGDCVAGYLPNISETVVAFLAAASLGATWSNCAVEMSSRSVLDRLTQIAPKVLFASTGYRYGGKRHDRATAITEIVAGLPSLTHAIIVPDAEAKEIPACAIEVRAWSDVVKPGDAPALIFDAVPFEHPLWILYSSGTTGAPKAIVHGHGGILLEHLKALGLHLDLRAGDRFFWYTSSGWMMWNLLISGLLLPGVTVLLYEGSPKFPDFRVLWDFVARHRVTYFGASAPYYMACAKEGVQPGKTCDLQTLRGIGSTGAPLPLEGFAWIYDTVKSDVLLGSVSGGTDVCTAFIISHPHLPVVSGKLQCLGLGAKIEAWNDAGQSVFGEVGELVMTAPFPDMPVYFWNDADGARFRSSYFEKFPGVWSHGDWIEIDAVAGPCVIHGRSDATLNRGGVRMGTSEFYAVVEKFPEIAEALVIDMGGLGREDSLLLFVALRPGVQLDETLRTKINQRLRAGISPRYVPDAIHAVPEIPHTLNGKKLEVPLKRILTGTPLEKAVSLGTVANPVALDFFIQLAQSKTPLAP